MSIAIAVSPDVILEREWRCVPLMQSAWGSLLRTALTGGWQPVRELDVYLHGQAAVSPDDAAWLADCVEDEMDRSFSGDDAEIEERAALAKLLEFPRGGGFRIRRDWQARRE